MHLGKCVVKGKERRDRKKNKADRHKSRACNSAAHRASQFVHPSAFKILEKAKKAKFDRSTNKKTDGRTDRPTR